MRIVLFCPGPEIGLVRSLHGALARRFPEVGLDLLEELPALARRLSQPSREAQSLILVAPDAEVLGQLLEMRQSILGLPLVLLLPDEENVTLAQGHLLRPRFLAELGKDSQVLSQVVCHWLEQELRKEKADELARQKVEMAPDGLEQAEQAQAS